MTEKREVVFIGAGPAGLGPLVYANGAGLLQDFLKRSVVVVERSMTVGSGTFGDYLINTNSKADLFLECFKGEKAAHFPKALRSDAFKTLSLQNNSPASMSTVADLLRSIGEDISDALVASEMSSLMLKTNATGVVANSDGTFDVLTSSESGFSKIQTRKLVLATGGSPLRMPQLHKEVISLCHKKGRKNLLMLHSGDLLSAGGYELVTERLKQQPGSRILVVGGGDSAFSAAWLLLKSEDLALGEQSVILAHRSPTKVTFESTEEAINCGYTDFTPEDICPDTGTVFRIGGLRFDAKELYLNILNGSEPRVLLRRLFLGDPEALSCDDLRGVEVVIFATGYFPNEITFSDENARPIPLLGSFTGKFVDGKARMLKANGEVLDGVYSIGLCSGYSPREGGYGGERSFTGLANSVMLCQGAVGQTIFEQLQHG